MILENDKKKNNLMAVCVLALGLLFLYLTVQIENPDSNQRAAFLMGLLLSSLGGLVILNQEERKLEVQPDRKLVVFTSKSFFGGESIKTVLFEQISKVGVTHLGNRGGLQTTHYFIYFKLKKGGSIRTGYSSTDEYAIKELAREIANTLGCEHSPTPIPPLDSEIIENMFYSAVISVCAWAFYYKMKVGPWCQAMWFGTAPALFMMVTFWSVYYFLMMLRRKYK